MFKLNPIKEAIFEGFFQRITYIAPSSEPVWLYQTPITGMGKRHRRGKGSNESFCPSAFQYSVPLFSQVSSPYRPTYTNVHSLLGEQDDRYNRHSITSSFTNRQDDTLVDTRPPNPSDGDTAELEIKTTWDEATKHTGMIGGNRVISGIDTTAPKVIIARKPTLSIGLSELYTLNNSSSKWRWLYKNRYAFNVYRDGVTPDDLNGALDAAYAGSKNSVTMVRHKIRGLPEDTPVFVRTVYGSTIVQLPVGVDITNAYLEFYPVVVELKVKPRRAVGYTAKNNDYDEQKLYARFDLPITDSPVKQGVYHWRRQLRYSHWAGQWETTSTEVIEHTMPYKYFTDEIRALMEDEQGGGVNGEFPDGTHSLPIINTGDAEVDKLALDYTITIRDTGVRLDDTPEDAWTKEPSSDYRIRGMKFNPFYTTEQTVVGNPVGGTEVHPLMGGTISDQRDIDLGQAYAMVGLKHTSMSDYNSGSDFKTVFLNKFSGMTTKPSSTGLPLPTRLEDENGEYYYLRSAKMEKVTDPTRGLLGWDVYATVATKDNTKTFTGYVSRTRFENMCDVDLNSRVMNYSSSGNVSTYAARYFKYDFEPLEGAVDFFDTMYTVQQWYDILNAGETEATRGRLVGLIKMTVLKDVATTSKNDVEDDTAYYPPPEAGQPIPPTEPTP